MKTTSEYEYILTVEVTGKDDKEEREKLKAFKKELMRKYGTPGEVAMATGMRLR